MLISVDAFQESNRVILAFAAQQANTPSSVAIDWSTVLPVVASIVTVLVPPLFDYLAERRALRDWTSILKAVDVYSRWAEIGNLKTVLRLKRFIDNSIEQRAKAPSEVWRYAVPVLCILGEATLALWVLIRGNPQLAIPAIIAIALMVTMLRASIVRNNRRKENLYGIDDMYDELVGKAASTASQMVGYDLVYKTLAKENEMDARMAEIFSSGDPLTRRLYLSALEKERRAHSQDTGELE